MKKRILILFLVIPLLLVGCSAKNTTLANLSEQQLASNQKLVTGKVTSITGNQIVLAVGTLPATSKTGTSASASGNRSQSAGSAQSGNAASANGNAAGGSTASGSRSSSAATGSSSTAGTYISGYSYNGTKMSSSSYVTFTNSQGGSIQSSGFGRGTGNFQRPDSTGNSGSANSAQAGNAGAPPSDMSGNGAPPSGLDVNSNAAPAASGNTQGNANASAQASASGSSTGKTTSTGSTTATASSSITLTDEKQTLVIPVGTKVLMTSSGALTTTTFGRILADDILELIVQTDSNGNQTVIAAQIME
ncbi:MAG: hypothetical protein WCP73_05550 [Eubacteriales bacterium]